MQELQPSTGEAPESLPTSSEAAPVQPVPEQQEQQKLMGRELFHVSGWDELGDKKVGDSFVLHPGQQGAEGKGVYFSESKPRFSAAEGAKKSEQQVVVVIRSESPQGWWRTKSMHARKHDRPKTWHTAGKYIQCSIQDIREIDGTKYLFCDWAWPQKPPMGN